MSNLKEAAIKVGKSETYFYVLKGKHRDNYEWLVSFDDDIATSYNIAVEKVEESLIILQDIIRKLEQKRGDIAKFSKWLYENGYFNNKTSFAVIKRTKWLVPENGLYKNYKTNIKIIEAYKKYKGEIV